MNASRFVSRIALSATVLGCVFAAAPIASAADAISFNPGSPWTQTVGNVSKTDNFHEYLVNASAGKTLQINLVTKNPNVYFSVMPAQSHKTLIDTRTTGDTTWSTRIAMAGSYTVRVYEDADVTPSGEQTKYALQVGMY
ncbi:MAG: hypothetical protein ABI132_09480 [Rhodanobacteraceae bacterium]